MKQGRLLSIPEDKAIQYGFPENSYQSELENFVRNHFKSQKKSQAFFEYIIQCMLRDRKNDHLVDIFCDSYIHLRNDQNNLSAQYLGYIHDQCQYLYAMRVILKCEEHFNQVMWCGAYQYMNSQSQMIFLAFIHFYMLMARDLTKPGCFNNQEHARQFRKQYYDKYSDDPLRSMPFDIGDEEVAKNMATVSVERDGENVIDIDIENFELPGDILDCLNQGFFASIYLFVISFFKTDMTIRQNLAEVDPELGFRFIPLM